MITLVYRYGLLPPTENAELVRQQIRDAHELRKKHVEIECSRRAAHRAALLAYMDMPALSDALTAATAAERAAATALKAARAERRNKQDAKPLVEAHAAAKAAKKEALEKWRARRAELLADNRAQFEADAANEAACLARQAVRAEFSQRGQKMRHGTYSMVEDAAKMARKAPLYDGAEPNDPKFPRWRGEGRIGAQIQGGVAWKDMRSSTWLRIEPPAIRVGDHDCASCRRVNPQGHGWSCPPRAERTNGCKRCCPIVSASRGASEFAVLRLRVGTDAETNDPVWASWPMRMHRALPEGALVTFAAVSLRKIGPREEWSTELTVKMPNATTRTATAGSVVAIDIGWRVMSDRVRVAAWVGSDGAVGELSLSSADVRELRYVEELRSVRDKSFNETLANLVAWLRDHDMPEWMRKRTVRKPKDGEELVVPSKAQALAYLAEWKSPGRLAALVLEWRKNRIEGDSVGDAALAAWRKKANEERLATGERTAECPEGLLGYAAAEAWRYHDYHLWVWEASQRRGALRRRRDIYRMFAKQLFARYETLVLEDFDLRVFARRKPVESQERVNETARSNRQMVALSELRSCLINKYAAWAWKAPCRNTTRTCNVCGVVEKFNAASERTHTCVNGHHWDQDDNAGANLQTIWRERPGDCKPAVSARKKEKSSEDGKVRESPRALAKRKSDERRARLKAAREAVCNASE